MYFCADLLSKNTSKKLILLESPAIAYIALGSNLGDRFDFLQKAVNAIFERLGKVVRISKVYETPSFGFEGGDFLNACMQIETRFSAEKLLEKMLKIETDFGRVRTSSETYENRSLDLDLLFYEEEIIDLPQLILPHPEIARRKFVLQPLADIAEKFIHPIHQKSIATLLKETSDHSKLEIYPKTLTKPQLAIDQISYLAIEGNIGAGKTSLATMISQDFNAKLITERFKDNPFLPKFYENQARYAFPLEMSFLADRYQQLAEDIAQYDLFNDFIVADYDIYKSMIFAGVTLTEEELNLYKKLFRIMYKDMPKPDLYVFLYQNTDRLLKNIKKRGRTYEQNIPGDYLENINRGYLDFIKGQNHLNVKIIDVTELDFVENREDYLFLLKKIISQQ